MESIRYVRKEERPGKNCGRSVSEEFVYSEID